MRVIASKMGFYDGHRRAKGEVFEVPNGVSAKWFTPVEISASKPVAKEAVKAPAKAPAKPPAKSVKVVGEQRPNEPSTLSEITKNFAFDEQPKGVDSLV